MQALKFEGLVFTFLGFKVGLGVSGSVKNSVDYSGRLYVVTV
jgi:hypothetical protein